MAITPAQVHREIRVTRAKIALLKMKLHGSRSGPKVMLVRLKHLREHLMELLAQWQKFSYEE